jgi:hypothetical protein
MTFNQLTPRTAILCNRLKHQCSYLEKTPGFHRAETLNAREMRLKSYQHTTRVSVNGRKASMQGTESQDSLVLPKVKIPVLASNPPSSSSSSASSTGVETQRPSSPATDIGSHLVSHSKALTKNSPRHSGWILHIRNRRHGQQ